MVVIFRNEKIRNNEMIIRKTKADTKLIKN